MKKDDDRKERRVIWAAKILWHIVMILAGFTAGALCVEEPAQNIPCAVYMTGVCLLLTGLYLWADWRDVFRTPWE